MRGRYALLITIIEGRVEDERRRGGLRMMLLDWMMKEDYSRSKERAGQCAQWRQWTYEPVWESREPKR